VRWAEKAGVKRILTNEDSELIVAGQSYPLPYHVCLSEFLYGAPPYKQRQVLWGLPNPSPNLNLGLDGAAPGGQTVVSATPDAGAATDGRAQGAK
jgi:hypothetical protein